MRVIAPNGLLVVDSALSHAKELVDFSGSSTAPAGRTSTLLTVGAGVMLIVKSP